MNDLISRQDAVSRFSDLLMLELKGRRLPTWDEVNRAMQDVPSAQPERKRGKWINDGGLYKCSYCNQLWTEWWAISKPIERMRKECPYCPMCGSYNG